MKKVLLGVLALCLMASVGYCEESKSLLQLTITSDKQVYEVGEEIKLEVVIKNIAGKQISFYHLDPNVATSLTIKNEGGESCPVEPLQVLIGAAPIVSLNPQETLKYALTGNILIDEGYLQFAKEYEKFKGVIVKYPKGEVLKVAGIFIRFSRESFYLDNKYGQYEIQATYRDGNESLYLGDRESFLEKTKDKWTGTLTSNPITIEVVERKGPSLTRLSCQSNEDCKAVRNFCNCKDECVNSFVELENCPKETSGCTFGYDTQICYCRENQCIAGPRE